MATSHQQPILVAWAPDSTSWFQEGARVVLTSHRKPASSITREPTSKTQLSTPSLHMKAERGCAASLGYPYTSRPESCRGLSLCGARCWDPGGKDHFTKNRLAYQLTSVMTTTGSISYVPVRLSPELRAAVPRPVARSRTGQSCELAMWWKHMQGEKCFKKWWPQGQMVCLFVCLVFFPSPLAFLFTLNAAFNSNSQKCCFKLFLVRLICPHDPQFNRDTLWLTFSTAPVDLMFTCCPTILCKAYRLSQGTLLPSSSCEFKSSLSRVPYFISKERSQVFPSN